MKFSSQLTEAILLKRVLKFMVEVVLPNRQKVMIRCPNIGDMQGNDILGTKIWYSNAVGYHCLPTWELAEIDNGHLVSVNPELMKPLVIEAIKNERITELLGYNVLHAGGHFDQFRSQFMLLEKDEDQCYMGIEHVISNNEKNEGLYPPSLGDGRENLTSLMQARSEGHRAVLLYCVTNSGIESIKPAKHIDPEYTKMLQKAVSEGVEIIAYRTEVNLEGVELKYSLPVLVSEDAISS